MDLLDSGSVSIGKVFQYVVANVVGYSDHSFTADHDVAVIIYCIRPMHSGYKMRAMFGRHGLQGQVTNPGRHSRAGMQYGDVLLRKNMS